MNNYQKPIRSLLSVMVMVGFLFSANILYGWNSAKVQVDAQGLLSYPADSSGNRIPDFSNAGYMGGGVALPTVPVVLTVSPISGDDTANIQAAINSAGALPFQTNGYRGTVLLNPGIYDISGTINLNKSGVVLAGSGNGTNASVNTILQRTGSSTANIIIAGGGVDDGFATKVANSTANVTDSKVQVGSRSFNVDNPGLYAVGDSIVFFHPSSQAWINVVDTSNVWSPGAADIYYLRTIKAISGPTITVDAPIFNNCDKSLAQSIVYKYSRTGFVTNAGIQNLFVDIVANDGNNNHAVSAISFVQAENCWIKNSTQRHFVHSGVEVGGTAIHITVENCQAIDPYSLHGGSEDDNFSTVGAQLVLFKDCYGRGARHTYVTTGKGADNGIVVLNCTIDNPANPAEGHMKWTTGILFDGITTVNMFTDDVLRLGNRGTMGSGHGWAAANSVMWNCNPAGGHIICQQPPTAQNFAIGCYGIVDGTTGQPGPAGYIEGTGVAGLVPVSLYLAQLSERLNTTQVAAPNFSPAAGTYGSAQTVTINTATTDASIRYTIDGSTPSSTAGTLYSAPVNISVTTTLKAIAYKSGMTNSPVTIGTYTINAQMPPSITTQPQSRTVLTGAPVSFSVVPAGAAPLSCQWKKNGVSIGGATLATYSIASAQTNDAGSYTVVVTNAFGTATSTAAVLTVNNSASVTFSTPGGTDWTCPANVTSVVVECWGGGGAGGGASRNGQTSGNATGGGGAGGAYAKLNSYPVTPGTLYYINVGAGGVSVMTDTIKVSGGDSWFNSVNSPSATIIAKGGAGGETVLLQNTTTRAGAGGVGTTTGSAGNVLFAGGGGGTASTTTFGGSGGGSAGTGSAGNSGSATTGIGATAVTGGGNGGDANLTGSNPGQAPTTPPGGGGGGARCSNSTTTFTGGPGAAGKVVLTYSAGGGGNNAPSVSLTAPANGASFTAPASIAMTATATDPDGTIATVGFYNGTTLLGSDTSSPYAYTWTNVAAGSYNLTARATDNSGAVSTSAVATVTVNVANTAPVFTVDPISKAGATEDASYTGQTLSGSATDTDGDTLSYSAQGGPSWLSIASSGTLSGTPANADVGNNSWSVQVSDSKGGTDTAILNITVANVNDAPVFTADPMSKTAATEDIAYTGQTLAGSATDVDVGATLTYSKVSGPAWLSVATDGTLSGTPANSDVGTIPATVQVSDGLGGTDTAVLNITVINVNDAPVFTVDPMSRADATAGSAYTGQTLSGSATDVDAGASLTYSKVSGPAWLSIATSGALSGTPAGGDVGPNSWTVQVSDGLGGTATAVLNITVTAAVNNSPAFTVDPMSRANATAGSAYTGQTLSGSATDPDAGATLTYSKVSGPVWLQIATSGALSGTPASTNVGANSWTVQVSDGLGGTDTAVLNITVSAASTAAPTFVAAGAIASGTATIAPALPAGLATGDILLLFVETANQAVSISAANGGTWAEVATAQGTGTAAGTSASRLTAFWSRYNGTQGAPTVSDSGNHQVARMIAVRGATASGNPWDVTAGGVEATSDTSASIPGATTTVANTLVVAAVAGSLPDANGTANFSAWANANLTSLTERTDNTSNSGNGGSLGVATGIKAAAGAYGNTTVTHASSAVKGMMSIAIKN